MLILVLLVCLPCCLSPPCRSEMGVLGRVCRHCKLDEGMRTWEARLFQLSTKALAAGTQVRARCAACKLAGTMLLRTACCILCHVSCGHLPTASCTCCPTRLQASVSCGHL